MAQKVKELVSAYNLYNETHVFRAGDLVTWKSKLLKNHSFLGDDRCGVVTRVLAEPVYDSAQKDAGSQSFREPLDIAVGVIDPDDGEFFELYLDSHRMRPYTLNSSSSSNNRKDRNGNEKNNNNNNNNDDDDDDDSTKDLCTRLTELYARLTAPRERELQAGDAVQWKKGLSNRKRPKDGEPAVVVETFYGRRQTYDPSLDTNTQYFREPLDIKIAFVDKDGEFMTYFFDSRRFELVDDRGLQQFAKHLRKRHPKSYAVAAAVSSASSSTVSVSNDYDYDDDDDEIEPPPTRAFSSSDDE